MKSKHQIIRPGNRKPFRKGTYEQVQERIEYVIELMRNDPIISRWSIQKKIKQRFDIEFRQAFVYITQAKAQILKVSDRSKVEIRRLIETALIQQIRRGTNVVSACNTLAEIHGVFAPRRVEQTGADGGPIKVEDSRPLKDVPAEKLRQFVERYNATASASIGESDSTIKKSEGNGGE